MPHVVRVLIALSWIGCDNGRAPVMDAGDVRVADARVDARALSDAGDAGIADAAFDSAMDSLVLDVGRDAVPTEVAIADASDRDQAIDASHHDALADARTDDAATCVTNCGSRMCGADGCGGTCGSCGDGICAIYGDCVARTGAIVPSDVPPQPAGASRYGRSIALSRDGATVVIGSAGYVSIFTRLRDAWTAATRLTVRGASSDFGVTVALSADGDTLAVGDSATRAGVVVMFVRTSGQWGAGTVIEAPSGASDFGSTVALSADGTTMVVGDESGGGDRNGAATMFVRSGDAWVLDARLSRPSGAIEFGNEVAISANGGTVVVGDWSARQVSIFSRVSPATWSRAELTAPSGADSFGTGVAITTDGLFVAVGDWSSGVGHPGAVYLYAFRNAWVASSTIAAPPDSDNFGSSVAMSDDGLRLLVGDPFGGQNGNGAATLFMRTSNVWDAGTSLSPIGTAEVFGNEVAISGNGATLAVGDWGANLAAFYRL